MIGEAWRWTDPDGDSLTFVPLWADLSGRWGHGIGIESVASVSGPGERVVAARRQSRTIACRVKVLSNADLSLVAAGVKARVASENVADTIRTWARSFRGDRGAGTLRVTRATGTWREISAVCTSFDVPEDAGDRSGHAHQDVVLTLRCPDPDWQGPAKSLTFASGADTGTFLGDNTGVSMIRLNNSAILAEFTASNLGDSPTWPVVRIAGPAVDPVLRNVTTGEELRLTGTLTSSDIVTIDTRPLAKTVRLDAGTSLYSWVDPTSTMWAFPRGASVVRFTATGTSTASRCSVTWRERFDAP